MMVSQQCSVLIVDDEPSLRKVLRTSLSAGGFTVEEARSGEEALGVAQSRAFDLVLLDINMPGMGGVETCRRLRDLTPRAGIVMVTVALTDSLKLLMPMTVARSRAPAGPAPVAVPLAVLTRKPPTCVVQTAGLS